jgi:hypothetical protein
LIGGHPVYDLLRPLRLVFLPVRVSMRLLLFLQKKSAGSQKALVESLSRARDIGQHFRRFMHGSDQQGKHAQKCGLRICDLLFAVSGELRERSV